MKIKKGKGLVLKGGNAYDLALADPFRYLDGLRGGEVAAVDFDPENINKSAHSIGAGSFDEQEIDIARTIREVVDSKILVPRDMKIDDSGIPVAKNVYEWCTSDRFSMINGEKPYIEQLMWGIITFNEYCVAKGSVVFTDRGVLKVEDFVGNPTSAKMSPMRARVATDSGSKFTSHGGMTSKRRQCLKVTYASGHTVTVTPDHRIQVLNAQLEQEWVRADKLSIGDYGVMPYGTNTWSKKDAKLKSGFAQNQHHASKQFEPLVRVTPELARLTGYIISDGFFNDNTIGFINTDQNVIDDFVACCEAVFGHTPKTEIGFKSTGKVQSTIPYTNVFLHGGNFVRWLNHIGFQGTDCYTKVIPDYILTSTKDVVVNCLRAIFDCDGFVDRSRVGIELASVECARQISMLMQNLGVYGKFQEYETTCNVVAHREVGDPKSRRGLWVSNSPTSVAAYAECVGSIHENKSANLACRNADRKFVCCTRIAPVGVMPYTKALFRRAAKLRTGYHDKGLKHTVFGRREFATFDSMLDDVNFVSFFEDKNPAELVRIRKLAKANYSFAQVVKVEDAGYHEVYDLTVPSVENFVCNGVVVHNCGRCTDLEYLFVDHKVDDTYRKLERKVALLENGKCPHCGWGRSKLIKKKKQKFIQELAVCAGQRSGKSLSIAGYFAPYQTHRLLKLQNPNAFYGLKTGTMLHCTFVALTYAQAKDTLWQNYYATLTESAWFREYHGMLRHYEEKYGEKLLKFNDTYVAYPSRGLMAYPAGPDKRVLRGRTRFFSAVDEVGYFDANRDTKKVKDNAHEVCGALDRSLLTVRGAAERLLAMGYDDVYPGYAMNVSSPSHRNDMIMTLVRRSENSDTMYGIVRPTWEVNPTLPRNGNTINEAFRTDPLNAERDYGAVPPLAANPFLQNTTQIQETEGLKPNPIKLHRQVRHSKKRGDSFTWAELKKAKRGKYPTIMALDAGFTNNSFAGVVARMDGLTARIEAAFEVIPELGAPLNHSRIFDEVLLPLMEARNVRILLADRWNSIKLLQDAKDARPELEISTQYSLKYKDMFGVKTFIQQGNLIVPSIERESFKDCIEFDDDNYPSCFEGQPISHLMMQMATVKDTGKSVDKADGYTDDIYRAMSLAVWGLQVEEYAEILAESPIDEKATRPVAIAASRLYSGGGGGIGGGSSSVAVIGIKGGALR